MVARLSTRRRGQAARRRACRGALSSLDYVLVLGVILPMVLFIMKIAPMIIGYTYEMMFVLVSWPFV
jgi:hypothetical protein